MKLNDQRLSRRQGTGGDCAGPDSLTLDMPTEYNIPGKSPKLLNYFESNQIQSKPLGYFH